MLAPPLRLPPEPHAAAAPPTPAGRYFPSDPPARATFAVKGLPLGALVEIEATALL